MSYFRGMGASPDGPKPDTTQALQDARPILGWFTDFFTRPVANTPPIIAEGGDGSVVLYPPTGSGAPAAAGPRELDTKKVLIGVALFGGALFAARAVMKGRR